jgi:hypothetical protein
VDSVPCELLRRRGHCQSRVRSSAMGGVADLLCAPVVSSPAAGRESVSALDAPVTGSDAGEAPSGSGLGRRRVRRGRGEEMVVDAGGGSTGEWREEEGKFPPYPMTCGARNSSSRQGTVRTAEWHTKNEKLETMAQSSSHIFLWHIAHRLYNFLNLFL